MKIIRRASVAAVALVALSSSPALADSSGTYSVSQNTNSSSYGSYEVNQRAGDTRFWLHGTLHKNYNAGCDWVEVAGQKMAELCNASGYKAVDGYYTFGILNFQATVRVCHSYAGSTQCGAKTYYW
ncbi:hypothetical protein ACWGI1_20050 [Streptomyces sp. NPDC054835]